MPVKPEPAKPDAPTDLQLQAEREQQAMKEIQKLRENRENQLKEAQASRAGTPEAQTALNTPAKFLAEADAYVRGGGYSSSNFGMEATLDTKQGGQNQGYERKAYIRFDLGTLPASIKSAKLRIFAVQAANCTRGVKLVADDTWQETAVAWNNAPAPAGDFLGTWQPAAGQFAEIDITEAVRMELAGDKKLSLLISATNNEGKNSSANFAARGQASEPELIIEPSTPVK
jgi:hypothetical protein